MKNTILVIFLNLFVSSTLFSQELNICFETGLGTFKVNDLKEINNMTLKSLPFDAKLVSDFPLYWNYKPSIKFSFAEFLTLGLGWSYQSTGSRISLEDYSGEYYFDTKIKASSPIFIFEVSQQVSKYLISFSNEVGYSFSKVSFKECLKVGTNKQEESYAFKSDCYYYEPGMKFSCPLSAFKLGLFVSYLYDLKKGKLYGAEDKNLYLRLSNGNHAQTDLSGVRFGVTFSYNLLHRKTPSNEKQPIGKELKLVN
jgi:hypothetical protein